MLVNQPAILPGAFAAEGDKNTIPANNDGLSGLASIAKGFPQITQVPLAQGGQPPQRQDFNGIFNLFSQFLLYAQNGGVYEYNNTLDYQPPCIISYDGEFYSCLQENGPSTSAGVQPVSNTTYWEKLIPDVAVMKGATASVAGASGLVPTPAAGSANRYLRSDGSWQVPPDTKYSNMKGATSSAAGRSGLVPAPAAGNQNKALFGDATYKQVVQKVNGVVADNEGDVSLRNALYCHDASEFMEELGTAGWNSKGVYAVTFSNTQNFPQKPSNSYFALFNLAETSNNGYAVQMLFNVINGDLYTRGTTNQTELDEVPFKRLAFYSEVLAALPVGTILPFAGSSIPTGFLACNGAAISRTTYSALFSAIGTTYGSGDGSTTFNLPLIEDNRFLEFASTAGTKKNAGLPNITGTFRYDVYATGRTGAFSTGSANDFRAGASQTGTIGQDIQTVFDASDSNSIYGGSTTVQPKSLTVRAIIKY